MLKLFAILSMFKHSNNHNYFDNAIKLFSDLYLGKFLYFNNRSFRADLKKAHNK